MTSDPEESRVDDHRVNQVNQPPRWTHPGDVMDAALRRAGVGEDAIRVGHVPAETPAELTQPFSPIDRSEAGGHMVAVELPAPTRHSRDGLTAWSIQDAGDGTTVDVTSTGGYRHASRRRPILVTHAYTSIDPLGEREPSEPAPPATTVHLHYPVPVARRMALAMLAACDYEDALAADLANPRPLPPNPMV